MENRYKDDTFHMLQAFGKTGRKSTNSGFGVKQNNNNNYDQPVGQNGNTWDARHMTNFLTQSNYSNWKQVSVGSQSNGFKSHRKSNSTHDHFFRTTTDNKNSSRFGYTKVNPLVSSSAPKAQHKQVLHNYLNSQSPQRYVNQSEKMIKDGKFLYQSNSVKFRITDPLTLRHVQQRSPSQFEKQRLKWLIKRRYPHGMTGIDHPQSPNQHFYLDSGVEEVRVRREPNSYRTHLINPQWKSKARVNQSYKQQYGFPKAAIEQVRKFRNDDAHGFNIITNRNS